jgi:hypothetical protein
MVSMSAKAVTGMRSKETERGYVTFMTARHLDILHLPVDLWVMIVQPVISQDQALLPKICDSQLGAL